MSTPSQIQLERYMRESNYIEGEKQVEHYESKPDNKYSPKVVGKLNPADMRVINHVIGVNGIENLDIKYIHFELCKHLEVDWGGKWRTCNVRVGNYIAPDWQKVPKLMKDFLKKIHEMDAWTAHNEFEKIHAFRDFNGRIGRLIWLAIAVTKERYDFSIPFLQAYYYQSLKNYND